DGDRDLEARRAIATRLLEEARKALDVGYRATAMQAAGRALALDPESEAAAFVTKLMLEPPALIPVDVESRIYEGDVELNALGARQGMRAVVAMFVMLPLMIWNGIASWRIVVSLFGLMALIATHAHLSQKY